VSTDSSTATMTSMSPEGMTLRVYAFGETREVHTPALHPQAEQFFVGSCVGATDLDEAVSVWAEAMEPFLVMRPSSHPVASVVVVESGETTGDDIVAWGRLLARLQEPECKTVIVCGGVQVDPRSDYDTLGALAAALIRQRLGLFIGVGQGAKPIATQVGLEGSWDGESVWADTPARAYDYLCDQVDESDVVVVIGVQSAELTDLMTRWGGVS
jgi:UDP-N-acetylmuramoyl-tripeptide--D-alanyl-D-alanine ligase